ncbi:MAG: hypothetical protein ACREOK_01100 [Gemmatimonadaceae bacterium]
MPTLRNVSLTVTTPRLDVDPLTGQHGVVLGTTVARAIEMATEARDARHHIGEKVVPDALRCVTHSCQ